MVSLLLSALIAAAFAFLAMAIDALRDSEARANHALEVTVAANHLHRAVLAAEATERAYVITRAPQYLQEWHRIQAGYARDAAEFARVVGDGDLRLLAGQITAASNAYLRGYVAPLITMVQRDPASAQSVAVTDEGQRQVNALRTQFDRFISGEQQVFDQHHRQADAAATRAIVAASASVVGSIMLILASGGYLARWVVRPVRRLSVMAGRVAAGDLTVRMPEAGPAEVGALERSFNTMTRSLEASRDELAASRARIVAAADEARRRIERDLHDGIQQRLISLALGIRARESGGAPGWEDLARTAEGLADASDELREICRGLHPSVLEKGGLAPALRALTHRSSVDVQLSTQVSGRLPQHVEAAVYYVVSEALTNATKHAGASVVEVDVRVAGDELRLLVRDDGQGGAAVGEGSGLIGLLDRVEAAGGTMEVESPPGAGTTLRVTVPLDGREHRSERAPGRSATSRSGAAP